MEVKIPLQVAEQIYLYMIEQPYKYVCNAVVGLQQAINEAKMPKEEPRRGRPPKKDEEKNDSTAQGETSV